MTSRIRISGKQRIPREARREIGRRYWQAPMRVGWRGKAVRTVTIKQLALSFGVSETSVQRCIQEYLNGG